MSEEIRSVDVIPKKGVSPVETKGDVIKIVASSFISILAIAIGTYMLNVALEKQDDELKSWATGLISLVVGAAIGFAFSTNNGAGR